MLTIIYIYIIYRDFPKGKAQSRPQSYQVPGQQQMSAEQYQQMIQAHYQ